MGFLFVAAVAAYLVSRVVRRRAKARTTLREVTIFGLSSAVVVAGALALLWSWGALPDWYLQAIRFPRVAYLGISGGTDPEPHGALGSLLSFPARFIQAHQYEHVAYYWYVPRAILAGAAIALWRDGDTKGEKVLLVASVTLVLWAAAFPSANYMHQWWTISLGIGAFVYCVRVGVGRATDWLPHWRLRPALPTTIAVVSLTVWPGVRERVDAAIGRARIQRQTINEPWVISGIKTDDSTSVALGALYESMVSFREHHPNTRVVSIDRSDGWTHGIAESLLWLSFFEPNEHAHPVYWSCPVLTTVIYPQYDSQLWDDVARTQPLLVESRNEAFSPRAILGYSRPGSVALWSRRASADMRDTMAPVWSSSPRQAGSGTRESRHDRRPTG